MFDRLERSKAGFVKTGIMMIARDDAAEDETTCSIRILGTSDLLWIRFGDSSREGNDCRSCGDTMFCSPRVLERSDSGSRDAEMQGRKMTPLLTQDFLKDTVMKYSSCVLLVFAVLLPFSAYAVVGICENDDGDIAVSIMTNNDGQLIDLAVTVERNTSAVFPRRT